MGGLGFVARGIAEALAVFAFQDHIDRLEVAARSLTKMGPVKIASAIDLEISDLPPPETVQGLWQSTPSAVVPRNRQRRPSSGFTISTL